VQDLATTARKTAALLPIIVLAGASSTLAIGNAGASSASAPTEVTPPSKALEAPASVTPRGEIAAAVPKRAVRRIVSSASTNGIPAAALLAYQRAAQIIDSADPGCQLQWPLIAAIGRVESDHGRFGGNVLSTDGVSTPGIFGIALDGGNGTSKIEDTDAGQYDEDSTYDRAVGPMQFIPSTWHIVGVDGDGDQKRNPQDIDDAALAAAVYLCSGKDDLSTEGGVSAAVYRYNHSHDYVSLVKRITDAYAEGSFTPVATRTYGVTSFGPTYPDSVFSPGTRGTQVKDASLSATSGTLSAHSPEHETATSIPRGPVQAAPAPKPTDQSKPNLTDVVTKAPAALQQTVSELQKATAYCQSQLTGAQINALGGIAACAQAYVDGGVAAVSGLIDSLGLSGLVGGLLKP
jgi:hypothetical protein